MKSLFLSFWHSNIPFISYDKLLAACMQIIRQRVRKDKKPNVTIGKRP